MSFGGPLTSSSRTSGMTANLQTPIHDRTAGSIQDRYFGSQHVTVIEPVRSWHLLDMNELWAYRELFWVLTARDVKVRYKQTALGTAWAVLRPLTTMLIFSVL